MRKVVNTILFLIIVCVVALRVSEWADVGQLNVGLAQVNFASNDEGSFDTTEAVKILQRASAGDNPVANRAWWGLGLLHMQEGETREAVAAWRNIDDIYLEMDTWAKQYERARDWETASIYYGLAAELHPTQARYKYDQARMLESLEEWQSAEDLYQQALDEAGPNEPHISDYSFALARMVRLSDRPDSVHIIALLDQAISEDQFSDDRLRLRALYMRGQTLFEDGQFELARQDLETVTRLQPGNYWAHVDLGRAIWAYNQDKSRAEQYLLMAVAIDPGEKWAYRHLATLYEDTGQIEAATDMMSRVLELDSEDEAAQRFLLERMRTSD